MWMLGVQEENVHPLLLAAGVFILKQTPSTTVIVDDDEGFYCDLRSKKKKTLILYIEVDFCLEYV